MSKYTSKKSFIDHSNVDRRFLAAYVSKKIKRSIPLHHISAVISFLFDELITELANSNSIIVGKFGKFFMRKLSSRRHYSIVDKQLKVSEGNTVLRFQFHKDIQQILTNKLDVAKTFGEKHNG